MFDRLTSLFFALCLASLVWLYARSRDQEILDHVPIPVRISLPPSQADQYELEVQGESQVLATFTGTPARIRELRGILQRGELRVDSTIVVPESRLKDDRFFETIVVENPDLPTPQGVKVTLVPGHNRLRVVLHRLMDKQLPVRFDNSLQGQSANVTIEPKGVQVRGRQAVLGRTDAIPTQPWILPGPAEGDPASAVAARVPLVTELEGTRITCEPNQVLVRLGRPMARKVYELTDVPVHFLCPAGQTLRPRFVNERGSRISLKITGPAQDEPPKVFAFVDLTRGTFRPGLHEELLQLQLPPGFQPFEESASRISFELQAPETPSRMGPPLP